MVSEGQLTVSLTELVTYLKIINDKIPKLTNITVTGELSNVTIHGKGNIYFKLKEENYIIDGFMGYYDVGRLSYKPENGDKVYVTGSVKYNQSRSNYQIVTKDIEKFGLGKLHIEFEKNKKLLEEQGYFKEEHKKRIPLYPNKIAIVTGKDSAALKDMLKTINHRYKLCQVDVYPCLVQGENAPKEIIERLNIINHFDYDVIILGRGGGSFEDLDAFNNVELAKTIFNSKIPIVTGIGHESDFTIADFVSDFRAATPTAAATKVTPDTEDLLQRLVTAQGYITSNFDYQVDLLRSRLNLLSESKILNDPSLLYINKLQQVDTYYDSLVKLLNDKINTYKFDLKNYQFKLEQNNINVKLQKNKHDLFNNFNKLNDLMSDKINNEKKQISDLEDTLRFSLYQFNESLIRKQTYLENVVYTKLYQLMKDKHNQAIQQLQEDYTKLEMLNPLSILSKGYALVYKDNQLIKDFTQIKTEETITVKNTNQSLIAQVKEVNINE